MELRDDLKDPDLAVEPESFTPTDEIKFFTPSIPHYVGYYQWGGPMGLRLSVDKRPRWLTRKLMKLLLEIEWIDFADENENQSN